MIADKIELSITVPEGSDFHVYHRVKFYVPLEELAPTSVQTSAGMTTYTYDAPAAYLHYELELDNYVKQARVFTPSADLSMTITTADLTADTGEDITDQKYNANIVMNVPDSKYLELDSGETFELYCYRHWQAINSITGNYYVDPTYHIDVISGDSVEITDPFYAGRRFRRSAAASALSGLRTTLSTIWIRVIMRIYTVSSGNKTLY